MARYPFTGSNGYAIGAFAIIAALGPVPVVGIFATLFLLVAVPKHALEVLRDSANGHAVPPRFGFDVGDRAVFAFLAILLAFAAARSAQGPQGPAQSMNSPPHT